MQGGYVWYAGRGSTARNGTATANLSTRFEELTDDARYLQYGPDPSGAAQLPPAPLAWFGCANYRRARTGVVPLDLSAQLWTAGGPATAPSLLASVVRVVAGENCFTSPNATSQLYHVLEGKGFTAADGHLVRWEAGDYLALPATQLAVHAAESDATLFWVHDEPLLRRLGVRATEPRFRPTKYPRERVAAALAAAERAVTFGVGATCEMTAPAGEHHPGPAPATAGPTPTLPLGPVPATIWPGVGPEPTGRIQVLLANSAQPPATGADHGLRAMAGVVPADVAESIDTGEGATLPRRRTLDEIRWEQGVEPLGDPAELQGEVLAEAEGRALEGLSPARPARRARPLRARRLDPSATPAK